MRDKYVEMRNNNQYNLLWFFDYYNQNIHKTTFPKMDIQKFQVDFTTLFQNFQQLILLFLDKEFNIVLLEEPNGQDPFSGIKQFKPIKYY